MEPADDFDPYHKWLGIAPAEQPPHHYRLLGIGLFEADSDVISNAADQRMVHLRAYQSGKFSDVSQRLLNEVSAARLCLLDPSRKTAYDQTLRQELDRTVAAAPLAVTPTTGEMPSAPPADVPGDVQQLERACHWLRQQRTIIRRGAWNTLLAISHAEFVLWARRASERFPAQRAGLTLVTVASGLSLGIIGSAIFTMHGLLLLASAAFGALGGAALAGHVLFVPSDEAMQRHEQALREQAAGAPEQLKAISAELAAAERRLAEARQR